MRDAKNISACLLGHQEHCLLLISGKQSALVVSQACTQLDEADEFKLIDLSELRSELKGRRVRQAPPPQKKQLLYRSRCTDRYGLEAERLSSIYKALGSISNTLPPDPQPANSSNNSSKSKPTQPGKYGLSTEGPEKYRACTLEPRGSRVRALGLGQRRAGRTLCNHAQEQPKGALDKAETRKKLA